VDIQQQLKRLGCYYGRIDGSWGVGSKDAMKFFMDRVNAALPLEQPDYVLLTLLQAQSGRTCDECPAGQIPAAGGRCVPQAIYAQTRNDAPQAAAAGNPALEGRWSGAARHAAAVHARSDQRRLFRAVAGADGHRRSQGSATGRFS
jgi:peptidoglycan hydrolase-like protein with peptidoglycan-binding domain